MIDDNSLTGASFIYRLDPRLKIIVAVVWSFVVALLHQLEAALLALFIAMLVIIINRLSWSLVLRRLLTVNVFVIFLWLFLPFSFSVPGEVVAKWGFLSVTKEGLALALLLTVKANAVAMGALALLGTSPIFELAAAAHNLGASEKLTSIFILMLRYFSIIHNELHRLRTAMSLRGFSPNMSRHSFASYANLVGQLLIRSLDRAERVYAAMLCRGYQGKFWINHDFQFKKLDLTAALLSALLITSIVGLEWSQSLRKLFKMGPF